MTSFGHTNAGPWYSDMLLLILRHQYNWRMSIRNRPNFPKLRQYNRLLIDRINDFHEQLYGYPKHKDWLSFNEALPMESPFGVEPVRSRSSLNVNVNSYSR